MEEADQYPENLAKKLLFCDMDASSSSILSFQKNIEREGNIFSLTKTRRNKNTDFADFNKVTKLNDIQGKFSHSNLCN